MSKREVSPEVFKQLVEYMTNASPDQLAELGIGAKWAQAYIHLEATTGIDSATCRRIGNLALQISDGNYGAARDLIERFENVMTLGADHAFEFWLLMDIYFERYDKDVDSITRLKALNGYKGV